MAAGAIKKAIAKAGGSKLLTAAAPIAFGMMDYNSARNEGKGVAESAIQAVGTQVFYDTVGIIPGMALTALPAVPKAAIGIGESLSAMSRNMNRGALNRPFANATFVDTPQAYTMRQAGMQLAQASKYNLQQTLLGNEAQYMKL